MPNNYESLTDLELDALIEDRIFHRVPCGGWEDFNLGSAGGPALRQACAHKQDECYPSMERGSFHGKLGGPGRYSTDIAAAWQVVEKMRERGLHCEIGPRFDPEGAWYAIFGVLEPEAKEFGVKWGAGCTAPRAICIAALRALESR